MQHDGDPPRVGRDVTSGWRTAATHVQSVVVESCWRPMVGDSAGDFHDVIDLRDGRIVVAIGDAVGYGPQAAAIAEDLRSLMRHGFQETQDVPTVLSRLDAALEAAGDDKIATVACAVIDPAARLVRIANAGHLPVVFVEGSHVELFDGPPDPPLGVPAARRELKRRLDVGTTMFLYTDGLIERRGTSLEQSIGDLVEMCRGMDGGRAWASEFVRRATAVFGPPHDDATVVSVRTAPEVSDVGGVPVGGGADHVVLRVYIDPRDLRARELQAVLAEVARRAMGIDVHVDVIDITAKSMLTEQAGVLAAPTIIRAVPEPAVRVIGWFNSALELANALQLPVEKEGP